MEGRKKREGGERKKDREGGTDRDWWGEEERESEPEHPWRPEGWGNRSSLSGGSFAGATRWNSLTKDHTATFQCFRVRVGEGLWSEGIP